MTREEIKNNLRGYTCDKCVHGYQSNKEKSRITCWIMISTMKYNFPESHTCNHWEQDDSKKAT